MANVIIGIHGLGNKPPRQLLEHWWKLAMVEGLKANNFNILFPKFEMVYWADVLYDKALSKSEKDINSPWYLNERYVKAPKDFPLENHDTREKIVDYLGQQLNNVFLNDDLSLNYSIITDTIVHRYFKDLEAYYAESLNVGKDKVCKAKDLIRKRLLEVLEKYKDDNIMLVSHSMGSIVAFDVLKFNAPHININSFITLGSPLGLPVVITKIAAEQKQIYTDGMQMATPAAVLKNWYNFADILDKVAFNFKLADDFSENLHGIKPIDFLVVNNYETEEIRNPHKSFGYLRTPEFSKVLHEFIATEQLTHFQTFIRKIKHVFNPLIHILHLKEQK